MQHFFPCWCATILSQLVCNNVFFSCWYAKGSSFIAGASQGALSLLVIHRVFCSFPAGDSQGLFSLLHKFPTLKFYHGNQTKQAVSELKTFKNQDDGCGGHLGFLGHSLSYFRSRGHPVTTVCFNSNQFGWRSQKLVFKMAATGRPFWICNWHDFSYFSSTRQPAATL